MYLNQFLNLYVHHLGLKVDALGGNSGDIHPNPNGSGQPYDPGQAPGSIPEIIAKTLAACCEQVTRRLWTITVALGVIALALILLLFVG